MKKEIEILTNEKKEIKSFLSYIDSQRVDLCRVARGYSPRVHTDLRTEIDSILIAYDQMRERINKLI